METSPPKEDYKTEEQYANVNRNTFNIKLQPKRIETNPSNIAVAKICFNFLQGKWDKDKTLLKRNMCQMLNNVMR